MLVTGATLVGRKVQKSFGRHGMFNGVVTNFFAREDW